MRGRAILTALMLFASAPLALAGDPVGHYTVDGRTPGGKSSYVGTVDVIKTGATYHVVWTIGDNTTVGTGIGSDKILSVSYTSANGSGVALFTDQGTGWLGLWSPSDGNDVGAEQWTRK